MLSYLVDWLQRPLKTNDGNAADWFQLVGVILMSLYLWRIIARDWQKLAD